VRALRQVIRSSDDEVSFTFMPPPGTTAVAAVDPGAAPASYTVLGKGPIARTTDGQPAHERYQTIDQTHRQYLRYIKESQIAARQQGRPAPDPQVPFAPPAEH
jgi:hypothetical protein